MSKYWEVVEDGILVHDCEDKLMEEEIFNTIIRVQLFGSD